MISKLCAEPRRRCCVKHFSPIYITKNSFILSSYNYSTVKITNIHYCKFWRTLYSYTIICEQNFRIKWPLRLSYLVCRLPYNGSVWLDRALCSPSPGKWASLGRVLQWTLTPAEQSGIGQIKIYAKIYAKISDAALNWGLSNNRRFLECPKLVQTLGSGKLCNLTTILARIWLGSLQHEEPSKKQETLKPAEEKERLIFHRGI